MANESKTKYVQFSKRVVVAVTACVTAISVGAIVLSFIKDEIVTMAQVVKMYISYAMLVFAAYSGNSAVQKWVTKKYETTEQG